jgi:hypothetical protein
MRAELLRFRSSRVSGFDFERPPGGFEELWCYCNTLNIFEQRHIAERIAWSDPPTAFNLGGFS